MDASPEVEGVQLQVVAAEGGRWPVVVLGGGFDPQQLPAAEVYDARRGLVQIHLDLPGAEDPAEKDHFGPASAEAVTAALRYARGEAWDESGCSLPQRLPELREELLVAGISNGGNLAVQALVREDAPTVHGLVTWETPLGAQAILQELVLPETRACGWGPDFGCQVDLSQLAWAGKPYLDRDQDGELDADEPEFKGLFLDEGRLHSPLLHDALGEQAMTVSAEFSRAWFGDRDAGQAGRLAELVQAQPQLAAIVLGSETDHVQVLPDSPHVIALGGALLEAGAWVRLNPDARYTGDAENPANSGLDLEDPGQLVSDELEREVLVGSALEELAWRIEHQDWSQDL